MKRLSFFLLSAAFMLLAAFSPANEDFPELTGKTLSGKTVTIPTDVTGKYTLVGIAYSMKAQDDLETWIEPVYQSLMDNPFFPVNLYFIPMTGDIKLMSQDKMETRMKEMMDSKLYKYILVYPGEPKPYVSALDMKEKDTPYFFVLDPKGKVVYSTSGAYSEKKLEAITDHMSE